ncbi:MAG TPA: hypothetical protein PKL67_08435, partial [Anaerolineae bacterium]|nr:hypothetical protein [Anaerolineae bacterium]
DTGTDIPAAIAGVPAATGALLSSEHGSGAWDGSGAIRSQIYTITVSGAPVAGVRCRMYADAGCTILVSAAVTNDAGQAVFWHALASGTTVYITRQHPGFVFSDPDTEVIP